MTSGPREPGPREPGTREPCCLCGAPQVRPPDPQGRLFGDPPAVCSPCRAERAGAIQLALPRAANPSAVAQRAHPYAAESPAEMAEAIQTCLRLWRDALRRGADAAAALAAALEGQPDEERVAHELMGEAPVGGLEFVADADGQRPGLKLTGLAPELARRLAETVPLCEGPPLSAAEYSALEAELGGR